MKKILLSIALLTGSLSIGQIVNDQVSVQVGSTNQVYYSLENGEVSNITNQDWDLAFDLSSFGAGIRINSQLGVAAFVASTDTSDWATLDTAGMASWTELNNSREYWFDGALNADYDAGNASDLGWGLYNSTTHFINGNKLFVLELSDGSIKKLLINSLIGGTYTFRLADLDNSNDVTETIAKSDYSGKNLVYYSVSSQTVLDREPLSADWDIVFTKYLGNYSPTILYPLTGALTNVYTETYQASGDLAANLEFDNTYSFSDEINIIGSDWKVYTGTYVIDDSLAYFVKTIQGDYWKVIFTGYGGGATGDIMFSKEKIGIAGVNSNEAASFTVYPNPTTGTFRINSSEALASITIYSANGQLVYSNTEVSNTSEISLDNLPNGMYLLKTLTKNGQLATEKIIKK